MLLVGGPDDIVESCRPAFEAVSERFVHRSPVGAALRSLSLGERAA